MLPGTVHITAKLLRRWRFFLLFFAAGSIVHAQSTADSVLLFNPFTQPFEIRRVLANEYSIPGIQNLSRTVQLKAEISDTSKFKTAKERCSLYLALGTLYAEATLNGLAIETFFKGLKIAEAMNDTLAMGVLLIKIGRAYEISELRIDTEYERRGVALLKNIQDPTIRAFVKYAGGNSTKDPAVAESLYREALALQEEAVRGNPSDSAALSMLSKCLNATGRYIEAIAAAEKIGDARLIIFYLNNLGYAHLARKNYAAALECYNRSLKLCIANKIKGLLKNTTYNMAEAYGHRQDWEKAAFFSKLSGLIQESEYGENYLLRYSEMQIKYEAEKRENVNTQLRQQETELKREIELRKNIEALLVMLAVILAALAAALYLSRKKLKKSYNLLEDKKNEIASQKAALELLNDRLEESERNLNKAESLAKLAHWDWDAASDTFTVSSNFLALYGVQPDVSGKKFRMALLNAIHPDDRNTVAKVLKNPSPEEGEKEIRYRIFRDGNISFVRAIFHSRTDGRGNVKGVTGTVQDVTAQVEDEEMRIRIATHQSFSGQLLKQQEDERARLAGDLHDALGQEIIAIKNLTQLALIESEPENKATEFLLKVDDTATAMLQSVRRIAMNLRPPHLERLGLREVLNEFFRQAQWSSNILIEYAVGDIDGLLPVESEVHLFRIVQETWNNIVKHSGAQKARYSIQRDGDVVRIEISDNGTGFDVQAQRKTGESFGLQNMTARVAILGAESNIESARGAGTNITIIIPIV